MFLFILSFYASHHMDLIVCISLHASHCMHPIVCIPFYVFNFISSYALFSVLYTLTIVETRRTPTDGQTG